MNNQVVTVNLVPGLSAPAVVRVSQYDYGRPIVFNILDGTQAATIDPSATITVVGTKPSGLGFSETALTISGGAVTLNTTLAMTQESGLIPAEIRIEKQGSGNVGTANFILAVEKTPHAEGTTDGTQESMQNLEARLQSEIDGLDDRIEALEEGQSGGSGLTDNVKTALLQIAQKVAYIDEHGQTYYNALYNALYPPADLVSITAVYTQSGTVYTTASLDDLKSDLTVSAEWSDGSSSIVADTDYTLSGTLTEGTSTVTVNYGGKSTTFDVTVTAPPTLQSITATYTQSGTVYDTASLDDLKSDLVVTANYSDSTSETVTGYTLSGTLTIGTSTVTVSYGGKTATFSVTVSHSALPSEYTKYDYIYKATSGNPTPIVTDAQLTSDYSLEMEFMIPTGTTSSASAILGTRTAAYGTKEIALFITQTTGKLGYWYAGKDSSTNITISNDVVHTIKVLPVGKSTTYPSNAVIDVDGTEYNTTSNTTGQTWSAWFGIFGYAASATTASAGTQNFMRIGEIIIKDTNGDAVYDFVPVSRNDNKNGFYETVNGTFYEATDMTVGNWE